MQFSHNSKYLFLYFIKYKKEFETSFVIDDDSLRNKLIAQYGNYFISSKGLKNKLYILSAKTWITSSFETPIGGCFHKFRRNVFHLGHGSPLKNIGLLEENIFLFKKVYYSIIKYNFSYFFSVSDVFHKTWQNSLHLKNNQILLSGQSRNDVRLHFNQLELEKKYLESGYKHILYAPTWRPYGDTELCPFKDLDLNILNDFLLDNKIKIHLRLHPCFDDQEINSLLTLTNISILDSNELPDINELLFSFDLLITDYSSIYIDFLMTEKPVLFLPYDIDVYEKYVGFSIDYYKYTPGPKPECMQDFMIDILKLLNSDFYKKERLLVNELLNPILNNQSDGNAEIILSKLV
ncbi:CDP-glycerol:poly(glycerophosphate) glycerophosphotransferase [Phocoenobacter uteri]|uniref:CDP-glycerol:poly(Glycerophosphate) glycerophosphotransferase n=2 Tax=Phocoenobacter uteri TaxID=146806 RepID=A0A379CBC0_9PAST|nr:CDP-glycerol:poly(glycerophosphate) glycerophosphotransferase [Phocoenobacter uteri]